LYNEKSGNPVPYYVNLVPGCDVHLNKEPNVGKPTSVVHLPLGSEEYGFDSLLRKGWSRFYETIPAEVFCRNFIMLFY
jgi:hypothetical protein